MVDPGAFMGAAGQRQILEELRERIRRLERRPGRRGGFLPSGRGEVDALLPGGGFPRGALAELSGGPASGKTGIALSILREALAEGGLAAFVDGRGEFYPPAARALGIDLGRLLIVRMDGPGETRRPGAPPTALAAPSAGERVRSLLWAAEALLGSGAFGAVAIDVPLRGADPSRLEGMLRRLGAAAEQGGAAGLWLGSAAPGRRLPAAVRIELGPGGRVLRAVARGTAAGSRPGGAGHAA
jgi:protein ImuA